MSVTEDDWEQIEDRFRVWSFYVYYKKCFRTEPDPLVRFVKALLASARPIRDRSAVLGWHRKRKLKRVTA